jgi:hypothetical protein
MDTSPLWEHKISICVSIHQEESGMGAFS